MDNDALINGFFEGTLSESQQTRFDHLLKTDDEFAADFEFQKSLQESLKKEERTEIKRMFSELNTSENKKETKVFRLRPWLAAASVALLVGISAWLLYFNNSGVDVEQLYNANFVPYENVVHPIERSAQLEDLKTRAFTAYEDQDYVLALELFKELQVQHADPYIEFYEAIVLMQLNNHKDAIPLLEGYIENEGQLKERARWYLALGQLRLGQFEPAKVELQKLVESGTFKTEASKELLSQLE